MAQIPTTYDEKERIWSGPKRSPTYHYDTSIGKIIFNTMRTWPRNVCQINDIDGVTVTFEQGLTWAIRIAQHFKKRGLNNANVVGIVAKNCTYLMPVGLACLMNGTPFHSVNPDQDEATISHVFAITKPTLIFCDGNVHKQVQAATVGWQPEIYTLTQPVAGVPKIEDLLGPTATEMTYQPEPLKEGGDQTMAILCSSGTTGLPKAVCISNNVLTLENPLINSEVTVLSSSGLDWVTGLVSFIFSTVFGATRIITSKPFTPEYFVQLVKKYNVDFAVLPPRHLSALISYPGATPENLAPLKSVAYVGGSVSLATLQRTQELCKNAMLNTGYGLTETLSITNNTGISHIASVGKPVPGVRMRIVDEDGKNLTYNQVGEILAHKGQAWNGYFGNPEATLQMQDSEGWFHTGDLGYFDEQNFLYIVDRKKEILKYQGLHYWPTEIESVISELPQVQDVCVVGIYDELEGDAAGALVVKAKGAVVTAKDISDHVAKRLPAVQKQLHAGVQFTDKLPANVNGKTLRKASRELFIAQNGTGK
ncbi:4-coumarate--CoA ligase 1 isoform X3 [Drosophila obscura]|uniref:4-coumarate--CoA ligase 1 isoform X3 n=1 Tax=Drosophila obscura TaxID=7282 RepID=UPI001BB0EF21|nr:4-coumarate--CoA ligase 1 isoform X3 [Drosophila obscura]